MEEYKTKCNSLKKEQRLQEGLVKKAPENCYKHTMFMFTCVNKIATGLLRLVTVYVEGQYHGGSYRFLHKPLRINNNHFT